MKDLGFLIITSTSKLPLLLLTQQKYIRDIISSDGLTDDKRVTALEVNANLGIPNFPFDPTRYCQVVGSLVLTIGKLSTGILEFCLEK